MRAPARRGRLLVVEGIDGSGKSTLVGHLARAWTRDGWTVATLREPHSARLGREAQLLGVRDPWASAMIFTLDRALARSKLEGLLSQVDLVIQDRSYFSTLAYQANSLTRAARDQLEALQRSVTIAPDRVVLLDVSDRTALGRVSGRGKARAPLERRRTLERVARAYRGLARARRWTVIDGEAPPDEVARAVDRALRRWLGRPPARRRGRA